MTRFLKRAVAIAAGILVFVSFLFLIPLAMDAWSHAFFKSTDFPGGQPPERFVVALRDLGKSGNDAHEPAFWKQVPAVRASGRKLSFLLAGKGGQLPSQGDFYSYEVIEDRKTSQIIEVKYINTHASSSRYEAYEDRIVPIFYRTDGSFLSLIPMLGLLIAGFLAGRKVTKLLREKFS